MLPEGLVFVRVLKSGRQARAPEPEKPRQGKASKEGRKEGRKDRLGYGLGLGPIINMRIYILKP